ncbi:MAG: hypothetical protein ACRDTM_11050 [Micromonosporaceae bacterium]
MSAPSSVILPVMENAGGITLGSRHGPVMDPYVGELAVAYSVGPPFGDQLLRGSDLDELGLDHTAVRRTALETLLAMARDVEVHGGPPTFMISFGGLESSLLLVDELWDRLTPAVPGDLVVGVPARDVMIVTGTQSPDGMARAQRACERVFLAGDDRLLRTPLLLRRNAVWHPL